MVSCWNKDIGMIWFSCICFSYLITVAGFIILCWRDVMRVGILVLFQILAERLSTLHHWYCILCGFVINNFCCFEIRFLRTHCGKNFYHEWMLNFVTCFSCTYWDDHVVWDECHVIVCVIFFFMWYWIQFGNTLLSKPGHKGVKLTCLTVCWWQSQNDSLTSNKAVLSPYFSIVLFCFCCLDGCNVWEDAVLYFSSKWHFIPKFRLSFYKLVLFFIF